MNEPAPLEALDIVIRLSVPSDVGCIFDAWLKHAKRSPAGWHVPAYIWRPEYHRLVEQVLERSTVLIAANPGQENGKDLSWHIYGFLAYEKLPSEERYYHFLYVKDTYRRRKVATRLLQAVEPSLGQPDALPIRCSHTGKDNCFEQLSTGLHPLVYDPFPLWRSFK